MELSERLKKQRIKYGYTQQQVSNIIGVDVTTYAHYESGRRTPDIKKLQKLCGLFDITIQQHFPLTRIIEYPPNMMTTLLNVKRQVENEFCKLKNNEIIDYDIVKLVHPLIDRLKSAIEPVQKIWEDAMSLPDMDLAGLSEGQTVSQVSYRPEDASLLFGSTQLLLELYSFTQENINQPTIWREFL